MGAIRYDGAGNDLARFNESATDAVLRDLVQSWNRLDNDAFAELRDSLTMEDFYTLVGFARRAALLAIRDSDPRWAAMAVGGLGAIDCARLDWRDVTVAAALATYALNEAGGQVTRVLSATLARAEPETAKVLRRFIDNPPTNLDEWGFRLVKVGDNVGLFQAGFAPYNVTVDLVGVTLAIAATLEADAYRVSTIEIASTLPDVWFRGERHEAAKEAISRIKGCVSINAKPRSGDDAAPFTQMFVVFVSQAGGPEDAGMLVSGASEAQLGHAVVTVAVGDLCCVGVARSFVLGVEPLETTETLARFRQPFTDALETGYR